MLHSASEPLDFPLEMLGGSSGQDIDAAALEDMIFGGNWSGKIRINNSSFRCCARSINAGSGDSMVGTSGFKFTSRKFEKKEEEEEKERAPREKFYIDFMKPIPEGIGTPNLVAS